MSQLYRFSLLVLSFVFAQTCIWSPQAAAMSTADRWDEIKDDFDLASPVRPHETLAELYYRLETRLGAEQKDEIAQLNKNLKYQAARVWAPAVKAQDRTLTFSDGGRKLILEVSEKQGRFTLGLNSRELTEEEVLSPLKTYAVIQELLAKPDRVSFWLWPLLMPEARADIGLGMGLAMVAVVGVLGYLIYKKTSSSSTATCKSQAATCCNVSGKPVAISNSCCSDVGGFNTGVPICPVSFYDQSAVISQQIRATSTGGQ